MLYFKKHKCQTMNEVIKSFPLNEFKSPYRSTIPLIVLIKDQSELFKRVIQLEYIESLTFEYATPFKYGKGSYSYSDLLVISNNKSVIVEAKRTEPKYITVGKWDNGSENRTKILDGWLEYISSYIGQDISLNDIQNVPYQMIHRIASACALNVKNIEILYLCFNTTDKMKKYYIENLSIMAKLTGNKIGLSFVDLKINRKDIQIDYEKSWDNKVRNLSNEIITGIQGNNLMSFKINSLKKI
ncbi:MAG: hypothetical protein OCD02_03240 [Spirochaetaceae bacterium]